MSSNYKNIFKIGDRFFTILSMTRGRYGLYADDVELLSPKYREFYILRDDPKYIIARSSKDNYVILVYNKKSGRFKKISNTINNITNIDDIISNKTNIVKTEDGILLLDGNKVKPLTININGNVMDTSHKCKFIGKNKFLIRQDNNTLHLFEFDESGNIKLLIKNIYINDSPDFSYWYKIRKIAREDDLLFLTKDGKLVFYDGKNIKQVNSNFNIDKIIGVGADFIITKDGDKYKFHHYDKTLNKMIKKDNISRLLDGSDVNIKNIVFKSIKNKKYEFFIGRIVNYHNHTSVRIANPKRDKVYNIEIKLPYHERIYRSYDPLNISTNDDSVIITNTIDNSIDILLQDKRNTENIKVYKYNDISLPEPYFNINKIDDRTFILSNEKYNKKERDYRYKIIYLADKPHIIDPEEQYSRVGKLKVIHNDNKTLLTNKGIFIKRKDGLVNIINVKDNGLFTKEESKALDGYNIYVRDYSKLQNDKIVLFIDHGRRINGNYGLIAIYNPETGKFKKVNIPISSLTTSVKTSNDGRLICTDDELYKYDESIGDYVRWKDEGLSRILNYEAILNGYTDDIFIYGFSGTAFNIEYKNRNIDFDKLGIDINFFNTFLKIGSQTISIYNNDKFGYDIMKIASSAILEKLC